MRYAAEDTGGARPACVRSIASARMNAAATMCSAGAGAADVTMSIDTVDVTKVVAKLQNAQATSPCAWIPEGPSVECRDESSQHSAGTLPSSRAAWVAHRPGTSDRPEASDNMATSKMLTTLTNVVVGPMRNANLRSMTVGLPWIVDQIRLGYNCHLLGLRADACPSNRRIGTISTFRRGFGIGLGQGQDPNPDMRHQNCFPSGRPRWRQKPTDR